jgi:chemotaxis methyl-accepting protein methylase
MYGSRRTKLATPRTFAATTEGHVVFVDRPALRHGPLDLSPIRPQLPHPTTPIHPQRSGQADGFLRWLFKRAGLDSTLYNPQTLARRLPACLRYLKAATPSQARQMLESEPELISPSLNVLLIGVSSFFRDRAVFEVLESRVLPELATHRASTLRVWSAACSDGHELYSVAMLAAEAGLLRRCELVGTDCRPEATYRARLGLYDDAAVRDLPIERRQRFFQRGQDGWRVVEPLRNAVLWRTSDVITCPEPGLWDLVFCRNMAMYLRPTAAGKLWHALEHFVRPGGYLVTGKAERPLGAVRLSAIAPCIYRKEWA